MGIAGCHPDDFRYSPISSGRHNVIWILSHPGELAPGSISSGWLLDTAVCHPDDISYHHMSSGWLSRNWYIIRMSYDNVIMSSGWHTLLLLSHPDQIANFDFPQHAVALQRFRNNARGWPIFWDSMCDNTFHCFAGISLFIISGYITALRWWTSSHWNISYNGKRNTLSLELNYATSD